MATIIDPLAAQQPATDLTTSPSVNRRPLASWEKPIRKSVYTLVVDNYAPQIQELTFPLLRGYAEKIGADFEVITERKRPDWPITIEKFQVAEYAAKNGDDWSIFFDADTLVSPEFFDPTDHMGKDTVAHNGKDMSGVRWTTDKYFKRDNRWFGSCTWCVIASDWTVEDLWRYPDLSPQHAFDNIHPTIQEHNGGNCDRTHLIDDYTLSRNIARFGLKATTLVDICGSLGWKQPDGRGFNPFLWHKYSMPQDQKIREMLLILSTPQGAPIPNPLNPQAPPIGIGWGLMDPAYAADYRKRWNL